MSFDIAAIAAPLLRDLIVAAAIWVAIRSDIKLIHYRLDQVEKRVDKKEG